MRTGVGTCATLLRMSTQETDDTRDHTLVAVEVSDIIDACGACIQHAEQLRKQARSRANSGDSLALHRLWLRTMAENMEDAARRMQTAADER